MPIRCDIIWIMKNKAVRSIAYLLVVAMCSATLSGCGIIPTLNLTPEQSTLIAEYAAGKLLEYVKGHPGGLMTVDDIDLTEVNPGLKKEEPPAPENPAMLPGLAPAPGQDVPSDGEDAPPPLQEGDVPAPDTDDALVDSPDAASQTSTMPLAEALGIPGAEITYENFEVAEHYPENGEELAFSMKAAEGKKLLIVHFDLSNPGGEDIEAHTDSNNFKVRLVLNGSDKVRGDVTFLDNDLMNYNGLLTPGATVDAVLVFEIPKEDDVTSMDLLIVKDGEERSYVIL